MAGEHTLFQNLKPIGGAALIGLGAFILFGNLTEAAARLSHLLGITAEEVGTPVGLWASHALQAYLFDHREFLRGLYQMLISFWPLVLVIAGAVLLRDGFTDEVKALPKKYWTCRSRCPSFDAEVEAGLSQARPPGAQLRT